FPHGTEIIIAHIRQNCNPPPQKNFIPPDPAGYRLFCVLPAGAVDETAQKQYHDICLCACGRRTTIA
ncbi:MAG: hypothetical protein ACI4OY_01880, partial [Aristaeellaceae bacterium]